MLLGKRWIVLQAQLRAGAVLAGDAGIEAADDFVFLAQQGLAEKRGVDAQMPIPGLLDAQPGEARGFSTAARMLP
jgi:hypothetical protein